MSYGRTKIKGLAEMVKMNRDSTVPKHLKSDIHTSRDWKIYDKTNMVFGLSVSIYQDPALGYSAHLTDFPSVVAQGKTLSELGEALRIAHAAVLGYQNDVVLSEK